MRLIDADHFKKRLVDKVEKNRTDGNMLISNILLSLLAEEVNLEPTVGTELTVDDLTRDHVFIPGKMDPDDKRMDSRK